MRHPVPAPYSPEAGIAIGPILFILAILAIIGVVIASGGSSGFSSAGITDRIAADIPTQANLIRAKISECNLMYGTNANYDGFPSSDTTNGTLVSAVTCTGDPATLQNLWTGNRAANLPPPSSGFNNWYYINTNGSGLGGTATGGRCIWIQPITANAAIGAGLTRTANKFTHATSNDGQSEVNFDPSQAHLRFVVWISSPPGVGAETANCKPQ
jgi:hypothetical protein